MINEKRGLLFYLNDGRKNEDEGDEYEIVQSGWVRYLGQVWSINKNTLITYIFFHQTVSSYVKQQCPYICVTTNATRLKVSEMSERTP